MNHKHCRIGHTTSSMWVFDSDFVTLWSKKSNHVNYSSFFDHHPFLHDWARFKNYSIYLWIRKIRHHTFIDLEQRTHTRCFLLTACKSGFLGKILIKTYNLKSGWHYPQFLFLYYETCPILLFGENWNCILNKSKWTYIL
jgi:hypothetical protein